MVTDHGLEAPGSPAQSFCGKENVATQSFAPGHSRFAYYCTNGEHHKLHRRTKDHGPEQDKNAASQEAMANRARLQLQSHEARVVRGPKHRTRRRWDHRGDTQWMQTPSYWNVVSVLGPAAQKGIRK